MSLAPAPSLDELAADPEKAAGLSGDVVRALTLRCAAVLAALGAVPPEGRPQPDLSAEDRLLTVEEAAARLGTTPRWLRRHAHRLPFTRRLSRKTVRYSEVGLTRWLARTAKST